MIAFLGDLVDFTFSILKKFNISTDKKNYYELWQMTCVHPTIDNTW